MSDYDIRIQSASDDHISGAIQFDTPKDAFQFALKNNGKAFRLVGCEFNGDGELRVTLAPMDEKWIGIPMNRVDDRPGVN